MITSNLFKIWKARESKTGERLTLEDVSQATGLSVPTLSRWMSQKPMHRVGSRTVAALTRYFGCSLGDLLVEVDGEEV